MKRDAKKANGYGLGTDWLGRVTAALWIGIPLVIWLQGVDLLPGSWGFSVVPFVGILAIVSLIILNIRNHRRSRVSWIASLGLWVVLSGLLIWGVLSWGLTGWGY